MEKTFINKRYAVIRNAHNISARKLSLVLGQSSEYINQIENGKCLPSIEGLLNFCDYFHITIAEFFNEEFNYPVEYKEVIQELNKMDKLAIEKVLELLRLINKK